MGLGLWTVVACMLSIPLLVHGSLLGGKTKVTSMESLDPKVVDFALGAVKQKLQQGGYDDTQQGQFQLVNAEKQIVQGVQFTLTFKSQGFTCQVVVWERLWMTPPMQVTDDGPTCTSNQA